jgi:hypothetical protein
MKVLIGCEYSATVRDAFARRGCDVWSCDLIESEKAGKHLVMDVFEAIDLTQWDKIILHPPCTKIALCGNSTYGLGMPKHTERLVAIEWTKRLWEHARAKCGAVAMENPKNVMGPIIGKRDQAIQPYEFGHLEQKETWLWIHGLPPLKPTQNVYDQMMKLPKKTRERIHYMSPNANRGKERARFFQGWADAMAEQWGSPGKGGSPNVSTFGH